ncbi:MAG: methyltransferase domain-containing protein [Eubacteriales bacterium]|nr:methyltransferase domain-containing protein [Eubacteriales bacterium]
MELLQEIESYWTTRTEGYSEVNQKELQGMQKKAWLEILETHFPECLKEKLKILDVGTGPGFFPRILAEAGYYVTAVDYTQGMLDKAEENAGEFADRITFSKMDAQDLEFSDDTFDVIISRNVTWNLEQPALAYAEWCRVLKPGGKLLNFDANWYGYLYDEEKRKSYEEDRRKVEQAAFDDHYTCTDIDRMEKIALQMPLSATARPDWDERVLKSSGFEDVTADKEIWKRVWSEEEKLNYHSTPMFMVEAVKKGGAQLKDKREKDDCKERVTSYWTRRSDTFAVQRKDELHSVLARRWMTEIKKYLPRGKKLRILDVGCGAGFFSILLAEEGHIVTGIDLTPDMVINARKLAGEELTREQQEHCNFAVMDAEYPEFEDETFDVVVSRNLTWTLPHADIAYEEWLRVLKKGGILLNMDADYGADDSSDTKGLPENHAHHMVGQELLRESEQIKHSMKITEYRRPQWDLEVLLYAGVRQISVDSSISDRMYPEKDAFYNPTPMFLICARKDEQ